MSTNMIGFGKNDKKVISGGDLEYYKGEKGRTDLLSIVWFFRDENGVHLMGPEDTPKFVAEDMHYIQGKGYITVNDSNYDYLVGKLGAPKSKIGTFVVQYRTDKNGVPMQPFEYEVKAWTFGQDKYRKLAAIHSDFPLTCSDFKVQCEDDQYQKLNFFPSPKAAIWQQKESLKNEILETVKNMESRLSISRTVPLEELREHFGDDVSPVPDVSADVGDYDDLLGDLG